MTWGSFQPVYQQNVPIEVVPALKSRRVYKSPQKLSSKLSGSSDLFLRTTLISQPRGAEIQNLTHEEIYFLKNLYKVDESLLGRVHISRVEPVSAEGCDHRIELGATKPAPFVWLEGVGIDGIFSDNGFTMTGASAWLTFEPTKCPQAELNIDHFTVKTLADIL